MIKLHSASTGACTRRTCPVSAVGLGAPTRPDEVSCHLRTPAPSETNTAGSVSKLLRHLALRDLLQLRLPSIGLAQLMDRLWGFCPLNGDTRRGDPPVLGVHVGPVSGHEWELAVLAVPVHLAALKGGRRLAARRALELRVPCRPAFTVFRPRLAATLSSLSPRAL